jgi:hypothetical protein
MEAFGKTHPDHMLICADDPGCNHNPPRVGRLGWVAYRDNPDEQVKMWTITIRNLRMTFKRKTPKFDMSDRQKMLEGIIRVDDAHGSLVGTNASR